MASTLTSGAETLSITVPNTGYYAEYLFDNPNNLGDDTSGNELDIEENTGYEYNNGIIEFDGVNDFSSTKLIFPVGTKSYTLRMKVDSLESSKVFTSHDDYRTGNGVRLNMSSDGLFFQVNDSDETNNLVSVQLESADIPVGEYAEYTFIFSNVIGENASVYVNGDLKATGVINRLEIKEPSSPLYFGRKVSGERYSNFSMDYLKVFDYDISNSSDGENTGSATIGEPLLEPEDGWKRYDFVDNSYFEIVGLFENEVNENAYNSTRLYSNDSTKNIKFSFSGDSIRLICGFAFDRSNNVVIKIDGIEYQFNTHQDGSLEYQLLAYEKLNLGDGVHNIEIFDDSGYYLDIDAIDLNDTATMFSVVTSDQSEINSQIFEQFDLILQRLDSVESRLDVLEITDTGSDSSDSTDDTSLQEQVDALITRIEAIELIINSSDGGSIDNSGTSTIDTIQFEYDENGNLTIITQK